MEAWKSLVALSVAAVVATGPAWAQTSTPSSGDKDKSATGTMDKGQSGSADKSATGTTGTTEKGTAGTTDKARGEMKADKKADKMDRAGGKAAKGGNQEQVKAAQQALKDKGHDPGEIDGLMGPKTTAALKDFQKAQGLKETGRLDKETMAKLEVKTSAAESTTPAASPKTDAGKPDAMKSDASKPDASSPSAPAPAAPEKKDAEPAKK